MAGVNIFQHYMSEHGKISRKNSTYIMALSIERHEVSVTFSKIIPQILASTLLACSEVEENGFVTDKLLHSRCV